MNKVNVSTFRTSTDRLFTIANIDYNACVDNKDMLELKNWIARAVTSLGVVELMECKRANQYDIEQYNKSITAIKEKILIAKERINNH